MIKRYMGEFEKLLLTMIGILHEDAYGNAIVNEIKERVGREVRLSAVEMLRAKKEQQVGLWKLVPQLRISGI